MTALVGLVLLTSGVCDLVNRYLFLLLEQPGSICAALNDDYCWGQDFNVREFVAEHNLTAVMGTFCSSEVTELKESESMPDLALAAQAQDVNEEMHSTMATGSEELLEGVAPLTTSDSLAALTLHAEVDAAMNMSGDAHEINADAPQSLEEAAATIVQVAEELQEEAGTILDELDAGRA